MNPKTTSLGTNYMITENPTRSNERKLYTPEQAAEILNLPLNGLQNLIAFKGIKPTFLRMENVYLTCEDIQGIGGYISACKILTTKEL